MMMPSRVRKVRSLLDRRETMAIENDSLICSFAMVLTALFYPIYTNRRELWFIMGRPMAIMRLNKFLAHAGVCSRREADRIIAEGRVSVNGQVVQELGQKIDPARDKVVADGRPVKGGRGTARLHPPQQAGRPRRQRQGPVRPADGHGPPARVSRSGSIPSAGSTSTRRGPCSSSNDGDTGPPADPSPLRRREGLRGPGRGRAGGGRPQQGPAGHLSRGPQDGAGPRSRSCGGATGIRS